MRDPLTWAAGKREVCWQIFDAHPGLAAWRRLYLPCFPMSSGDPRRPSRNLFSRQPVINKVLSLGCRRMVDMCPPFATFLLGSKEGASRSFEKPEGDTSDPRFACENACAQFACRIFLARLANGAMVVLEHPSASWLWTFVKLQA